MWQYVIEAGIIAFDWVYHRYLDPPIPPKPAKQIEIPRVDAGAPYPLVYGRMRVKAPVLAWVSIPVTQTVSLVNGVFETLYFMDLFFAVGIGFQNGTNHIISVWSGDTLFQPESGGGGYLNQLKGNGGTANTPESPLARLWIVDPTTNEVLAGQGYVEWLNGSTSQQLVNTTSPFAWTTYAGKHMTVSGGSPPLNGSIDPSLVPGYRGIMCAFFHYDGTTPGHWFIGKTPNLPQYSIEVSSYPAAANSFGPSVTAGPDNGDCNPIDALFDLLTSQIGKLGLPTTMIDTASFTAAAKTLATENHGFSRSFEDGTNAKDLIDEILKQIDAVLFEDPATGTLKIKLIRNDYTFSQCAVVDPSVAVRLENASMGGWTDVPNKIRVLFSNRQDDYKQGSGVAMNMANAVGQSGEIREIQLQMPGITTQDQANEVAARELAARSRPIFKCRAICNRKFYATLPGDVVRLNWPEWGLYDVPMRVAAADRGTLQNGAIGLDLISDFFHVWRSIVTQGRGIVSLGAKAIGI